MVLLAVLALGGSWWLINALRTPINRVTIERDHNARVLADAKQALLGQVAMLAADSTENFPGRLPCPEPAAHVGTAYEGISAPYLTSGATTCSNVGRLPWRTLGIDELRDAAGEPLWYVVPIGPTGWALQTASTVLSINSNKTGTLNVNGAAVVAAIIAPGRPLNVNPDATQVAAGCAARTQNRTAVPPDYRDYLECQNIAGNVLLTGVANNATHEVLNDQMVTITAAEVMTEIEGTIAKRIQASVVPQLRAAYANADWGASAATPVFPYAARFQNAGTFNPDNYQGSVGSSQGLLPMTAQTCNALSAGRCDSNFGTALAFVQWTAGTFSVVKTGGTSDVSLTSADCTSSTTSQIRCVVNYSQTLCLLSCAISINVTARGNARNVGKALKTLNAGAASVTTTPPSTASGGSLTAALLTDGLASARASYSTTLQGGSAGICGFFISLLCSGSAVITVPITVFQDHPLVNPGSGDAWYWFIVNKWYEVAYYAAAPSHLPSGATHNCSTAGDCLAVTGGSPSSNVSSLLVLAGRSLTNTARPNSTLADFLEDANNRDGNGDFNQGALHRTDNDRFVSIANY